MRLIDVDAAIDCIKAGIEEDGNFESDAIHLIEFLNVFARSNNVEALPLNKLCKFLGGAVTPCILLNIGCPYNEATRKDCDSCRAREAWKMTLSKWMEEQDAADKR